MALRLRVQRFVMPRLELIMPPRTAEQDQAARFAAVEKLRGTGFYPIGGWLFMKDGVAYDLSAADLDQIKRIEQERLFVVEITDLPTQAQQTRDAAIASA